MKKIFSFFAAILFSLLAQQAFALIEVSECGELNEPNETYFLVQDIAYEVGCFSIFH